LKKRQVNESQFTRKKLKEEKYFLALFLQKISAERKKH
jgi:hypothetical protein